MDSKLTCTWFSKLGILEIIKYNLFLKFWTIVSISDFAKSFDPDKSVLISDMIGKKRPNGSYFTHKAHFRRQLKSLANRERIAFKIETNQA